MTADIDWNTPPRRPKMKTLAPLPAGAVTITITCRACGARANVEIAAPAKLCRECCADLEATKTHIAAMRAGVAAQQAEDSEAWANYAAGLDEALAARFDRVCSDRTNAETALRQAERAKGRQGEPAPLERIAACRAALAGVRSRIAATRANTANPLSAVLEAEAVYLETMARTQEQLTAWDVALQEVEAAEAGGLPF